MNKLLIAAIMDPAELRLGDNHRDKYLDTAKYLLRPSEIVIIGRDTRILIYMQ